MLWKYVKSYFYRFNLQVHDRAQVFISCRSEDNGRSPTYAGVIERWSNSDIVLPNIKCTSNVRLFILVCFFLTFSLATIYFKASTASGLRPDMVKDPSIKFS